MSKTVKFVPLEEVPEYDGPDYTPALIASRRTILGKWKKDATYDLVHDKYVATVKTEEHDLATQFAQDNERTGVLLVSIEDDLIEMAHYYMPLHDAVKLNSGMIHTKFKLPISSLGEGYEQTILGIEENFGLVLIGFKVENDEYLSIEVAGTRNATKVALEAIGRATRGE